MSTPQTNVQLTSSNLPKEKPKRPIGRPKKYLWKKCAFIHKDGTKCINYGKEIDQTTKKCEGCNNCSWRHQLAKCVECNQIHKPDQRECPNYKEETHYTKRIPSRDAHLYKTADGRTKEILPNNMIRRNATIMPPNMQLMSNTFPLKNFVLPPVKFISPLHAAQIHFPTHIQIPRPTVFVPSKKRGRPRKEETMRKKRKEMNSETNPIKNDDDVIFIGERKSTQNSNVLKNNRLIRIELIIPKGPLIPQQKRDFHVCGSHANESTLIEMSKAIQRLVLFGTFFSHKSNVNQALPIMESNANEECKDYVSGSDVNEMVFIY